jgi:hypothetical protein
VTASTPAATTPGAATPTTAPDTAAPVEDATASVEVAGAYLTCDRAPEQVALVAEGEAPLGCGFFGQDGRRAVAAPAIKKVGLAFSDDPAPVDAKLVDPPAAARWQKVFGIPAERAAKLTSITDTHDGAGDAVALPFKPTAAPALPLVGRFPVTLAQMDAVRHGTATLTCDHLAGGIDLLLAHAQCHAWCQVNHDGAGGRFQGCTGAETADCLCVGGKAEAHVPLEVPIADLKRTDLTRCEDMSAADAVAIHFFVGQTMCSRPEACGSQFAGTGGIGFANECNPETHKLGCDCARRDQGFSTLQMVVKLTDLQQYDAALNTVCQASDLTGTVPHLDKACDSYCVGHDFTGGWAGECGGSVNITNCFCVK